MLLSFRRVPAIISLFLAGFAPLAAAPLTNSGQFSLSGTVYVAQSEFLFGYFAAPTDSSADQKAAILLPSQDVFGALRAGELVGIKNLLTPGNTGPFGPGPVIPGSTFLLPNFITLPDRINIDLTGLTVSSDLPVCGGGIAPGISYTCLSQPGSPVILAQNATGVTAILNLLGQAHIPGYAVPTQVIGKISANFTSGNDATIDGLLADFVANGFIETSFSANLSTLALTTPEPAPSALAFIGLLSLGLICCKKKSA
jgi:hypothetical protein